jgi:hypothetical protein
MLTSEARVRTDRATRYLTQLCDHGGNMRLAAFHRRPSHRAHAGADGPPPVLHARSDGTDGVIDFGWGRCTLQATAEDLVLTARAEDEQGLQRIQDGIAARLQRIGRRDGLTVVWRQSASEAGPHPAVDERG